MRKIEVAAVNNLVVFSSADRCLLKMFVVKRCNKEQGKC